MQASRSLSVRLELFASGAAEEIRSQLRPAASRSKARSFAYLRRIAFHHQVFDIEIDLLLDRYLTEMQQGPTECTDDNCERNLMLKYVTEVII